MATLFIRQRRRVTSPSLDNTRLGDALLAALNCNAPGFAPFIYPSSVYVSAYSSNTFTQNSTLTPFGLVRKGAVVPFLLTYFRITTERSATSGPSFVPPSANVTPLSSLNTGSQEFLSNTNSMSMLFGGYGATVQSGSNLFPVFSSGMTTQAGSLGSINSFIDSAEVTGFDLPSFPLTTFFPSLLPGYQVPIGPVYGSGLLDFTIGITIPDDVIDNDLDQTNDLYVQINKAFSPVGVSSSTFPCYPSVNNLRASGIPSTGDVYSFQRIKRLIKANGSFTVVTANANPSANSGAIIYTGDVTAPEGRPAGYQDSVSMAFDSDELLSTPVLPTPNYLYSDPLPTYAFSFS